MKVAVIGAGALGCLYGGLLADAGHEVWLLHHREAYVEALAERGVRIESDHRADAPIHVEVPATVDAAAVGDADLALVLVKAHVTRTAVADHAACIGPDTAVASLQNGFRNYEVLCELVGEERALAGVASEGAVTEAPGVVRHTGSGRGIVGGTSASYRERASDALADAGIEVRTVADPRPYVWRKQIRSMPFKPMAALTRLSKGALVADERRARMAEAVIEEALAVAAARGIELPEAVSPSAIVERAEGSTHEPSMLQDVTAERKTEIDEINGAVVEIADEEGVDVPHNRALTALVRGLERSYLDGR